MREIKFRAWSPSLKKWRSDWSISEYTEVLDLNETRIDDDLILCQYTGLKDKNGILTQEIYEGDVVLVRANGFNDHKKQVVFSSHRGWGLPEREIQPGGMFNESDWEACFTYEIIGNIYENPELLKGDAK